MKGRAFPADPRVLKAISPITFREREIARQDEGWTGKMPAEKVSMMYDWLEDAEQQGLLLFSPPGRHEWVRGAGRRRRRA